MSEYTYNVLGWLVGSIPIYLVTLLSFFPTGMAIVEVRKGENGDRDALPALWFFGLLSVLLATLSFYCVISTIYVISGGQP